jgi:hypothetical protein
LIEGQFPYEGWFILTSWLSLTIAYQKGNILVTPCWYFRGNLTPWSCLTAYL